MSHEPWAIQLRSLDFESGLRSHGNLVSCRVTWGVKTVILSKHVFPHVSYRLVTKNSVHRHKTFLDHSSMIPAFQEGREAPLFFLLIIFSSSLHSPPPLAYPGQHHKCRQIFATCNGRWYWWGHPAARDAAEGQTGWMCQQESSV